ncbi:MAG: NusG domain II-containing protein [Spirochaetia bacterium]|nr:NusG domain II-containing protein [Spirochaetia bacterium]MBQ3713906.1 NusG domain II-containing protein [Spirochaetia bacterium]
MKFSFKPADFLFLALSVILIAMSLIALSGNSEGTPIAVIRVKDTEYIYPLNQPRELEFTGELDKAHLIIHDGCIEFVQSPCRDKVCIHMGQARKEGDFLACLPNRIIVTVEGGKVDTDN